MINNTLYLSCMVSRFLLPIWHGILHIHISYIFSLFMLLEMLFYVIFLRFLYINIFICLGLAVLYSFIRVLTLMSIITLFSVYFHSFHVLHETVVWPHQIFSHCCRFGQRGRLHIHTRRPGADQLARQIVS